MPSLPPLPWVRQRNVDLVGAVDVPFARFNFLASQHLLTPQKMTY